MSIEAMKQALEALDEAANVLTSRMFADAAAALREAIEQAEKQEPVAWQQELGNILCLIHRDGGHYISEHGWRKAIDDATLKVANLNSYMSVPQYEHPEPVAFKWNGELFTPGEIEMLDVTDAVPLYEHPREWRTVPQEEFDMLMDEVFSVTDQMMFGHNVWEFYEICEARLKELNTMQGNNEVIGKWIEKRREGEAI
jgi:hypothetical protein